MFVLKDEELRYFNWDDRAKNFALLLTDKDWERLEYEIEKRYPHYIWDWQLQDLFAKDFDRVCHWLGFEYDPKTDSIDRGDEE